MPPINRAKLGTVVSPQCRPGQNADFACHLSSDLHGRALGHGPSAFSEGSGIRHLQDLDRAQIDPNIVHMSMNGIPKSWNQDPERYGEISYLHEQIPMIAGGEPFCKSSCISM